MMLIHKHLTMNHMIQVNSLYTTRKERVGMSGGDVVLDINQQIKADIVMILM